MHSQRTVKALLKRTAAANLLSTCNSFELEQQALIESNRMMTQISFLYCLMKSTKFFKTYELN